MSQRTDSSLVVAMEIKIVKLSFDPGLKGSGLIILGYPMHDFVDLSPASELLKTWFSALEIQIPRVLTSFIPLT